MIHNEEINQSMDIDPRLTHMVQLKNNKKTRHCRRKAKGSRRQSSRNYPN